MVDDYGDIDWWMLYMIKYLLSFFSVNINLSTITNKLQNLSKSIN